MEPWALWCLIYGSVGLIPAPFAALKGKWGSFALGFVIPLAWIVAGSRLAKPYSWWSKQFYDQAKFQEARDRYSWRGLAPGSGELSDPGAGEPT